ncbi:hypothetical protein [Paracoccus aestuariivivens]|uniref:Uncharacterized protein n=1 Tax=Paracoccus aestuariivivens TaxID=1820333 RepID=A0A6L6JHN8_9RHOB|nr:hypothetical protein [Paracoccus aestuariivivens]MTH79401.1 hypothetical protein [Paracoccus aestuariivivens]
MTGRANIETSPTSRQITIGLITVRMLTSEGIELIRKGAAGRGKTQRQVLWNREQIEAAWISASSRKGQDAQDQSKALRWALEEIGRG